MEVLVAAAVVVVTSLARGGEAGGRAYEETVLNPRRKYRNNSVIQRT